MALDETVLESLNHRFPCRRVEIRNLATLLSSSFPSPSSLVIHGLEATGKSSITKATLESLDVRHAIVDSRECITGRHLLEKAAATSREVVNKQTNLEGDDPINSRCENLGALSARLERILKDQDRFVLVFDGIDRQKEAPATLIPALTRIASTIPPLIIVFIISVPSPRLLHSTGVPHIHFPPYTRDQSIKIISKSPPVIFLKPVDPSYNYGEEEAKEDREWLWGRYCGVVWDALAKGAARDLSSFQFVCEKLWRPFVQPIIDGTFGTRDFSRLLVFNRALLQSEDAFSGNLVPKDSQDHGKALSKVTLELPYYAKFVLCAAYLASYNPPRQDQVYFMKSSQRKRRKRGGAGVSGRISKHRKIPRNLLAPSPFSLDRLLAILHSIIPHSLPQTGHVFSQIATLCSLRLLLRPGASTADPLDPTCRFRVNCAWEYVASLGRSVGLEMRDYLAGS